jgi:DNA-binding LacI/PurR family transcriptional regulator
MGDSETARAGKTAAATAGAGRAGLRQVAERAGISVATASAILGHGRSNTRFSARTRDRVLHAAQELRYQPNAVARALTGQPTRTLGILFGIERASVAVANPFIFTLLQGIVAAAAEAGYNVTLFTEPWHNAAVSGGLVRDRRTDGVIVIAPSLDSDILSCLVEFDVPFVSVATPADDGLAPSVDVDNTAGARLATEHLLSLGHRRIAHITGDYVLRSGFDRRDAFVETMARAGLTVPPEYIVPGIYSAPSGFDGTLRLLALPQPPTAIFAASDNIAQGAYRAARQCGVGIPESLSVIGFDNVLDGAEFEPPLTTVHQPLREIGAEAARQLLRRVQRQELPSSPSPTLFPPTLVLRASTAPPAPVSRPTTPSEGTV